MAAAAATAAAGEGRGGPRVAQRLSRRRDRQGQSSGGGTRCLGARAETAPPQDMLKSAAELAAEAGVDDGVDAAVEIAQPEGDLEDGLGGFKGREDGAYG